MKTEDKIFTVFLFMALAFAEWIVGLDIFRHGVFGEPETPDRVIGIFLMSFSIIGPLAFYIESRKKPNP